MPKLKNKSKQYLFKNKLNIRRKSKLELLKESFFLLISGVFLLLINYFIPEKLELIKSFKDNLFEIFDNILNIMINFFEIFIVLLIYFSLFFSLCLIIGSMNRLVKVLTRKSKKIKIR